MKVSFRAKIQQFGELGEKTGWRYIAIPSATAQKLLPGNKKSFRVRGTLDQLEISGLAAIPMGDGSFIIALKSDLRKKLRKEAGATVDVRLEFDDKFKIAVPEDLQACLDDEPAAATHFSSLPLSHRHYFIKWLDSAKTDPTRVKRITMMVAALARGWGYPEMIRAAAGKNPHRDRE